MHILPHEYQYIYITTASIYHSSTTYIFHGIVGDSLVESQIGRLSRIIAPNLGRERNRDVKNHYGIDDLRARRLVVRFAKQEIARYIINHVFCSSKLLVEGIFGPIFGQIIFNLATRLHIMISLKNISVTIGSH